MDAIILREIEVRRNEPVEVIGISGCHIVRALQTVVISRTREAPRVQTACDSSRAVHYIIRMRLAEHPLVRIKRSVELFQEVRTARGLESSLLREAALSPFLTAESLYAPYIVSQRRQTFNGIGIRLYYIVEGKSLFFQEVRVCRNLKQITAGRVNAIPCQFSMISTCLQHSQIRRIFTLLTMSKRDVVNPDVITGLLRLATLLEERSHEGHIRPCSAGKFHFRLLEEEVITRHSSIGSRERAIIGYGIDRHEGSRIGRIGHSTDDNGLGISRTRVGSYDRVVRSRYICRTHPEHDLQRIVCRHIHCRHSHIRLIGGRSARTI